MIVNNAPPRIQIENQNTKASFTDYHPRTVSYTSPAIAHRGSIGIKDVSDGSQYLVGFIQFISIYKNILMYKKGKYAWDLSVPISDGGGGDAPQEFKTDRHEPNALFPWYQPPLKVDVNKGKSRRDPYTFYSTRVTDAPQATIPWLYDQDKSNSLMSLTRAHRFECWLVIWDKKTSRIVEYLSKSVWDHGASITFDYDAPQGQRVKINECFNESFSISDAIGVGDTIPDKALRAPNANTAAKTAGRYEGYLRLPPSGTAIR